MSYKKPNRYCNNITHILTYLNSHDQANVLPTKYTSHRISELDRKTNEYIREKMDAQDTVLDDITRKQLIWCRHVDRMKPTMINWKHEGLKKTKSSPKNPERWDIYSYE